MECKENLIICGLTSSSLFQQLKKHQVHTCSSHVLIRCGPVQCLFRTYSKYILGQQKKTKKKLRKKRLGGAKQWNQRRSKVAIELFFTFTYNFTWKIVLKLWNRRVKKKAVMWLHKSSKPIVRGLRSSALEEFEFRCRTASFPKVIMSNTIHFRVEDLRQAKNN